MSDDGVCVFDTWLGDDLVAAHPLLLVTTPLKRELDRLALRCVEVQRARCRTSPFFRRHDPGRRLPPFWAVKVHGTAGVDDVGVTPDGALVISQPVLDVLMRHRILQASLGQYAAR